MVGGPCVEAGYYEAETYDDQVGGGPHACAGSLEGLGASVWDDGVSSGDRRQGGV